MAGSLATPGSVHQRLSEEVLADLDGWVARIVDRVQHEVPRLVRDDTSAELAISSSRALLEEFAGVLAAGELPASTRAPGAALAFARHLARTDAPLSGLLRSYRLGQEMLFDRAARLAGRGSGDDLRDVGLLTFRFLDVVVGEVSETFERERESVVRGSALRRERLVHRLLAGEDVPRAEAERVLGWRMTGSHLAAVAWPAEDDVEAAAVTAALRRVLGWAGRGAGLLMPGVAGESFAWVRPTSVDRASPPADLLASLTGSGVRVAFGEPAADLAGFVASRRQAEAARRVARHLPQRPLVAYGEVALLQLLVADPVAAAAFVRAELGRLAEEPNADLRETARRYLELGQDATATAAALGVHRNTVMRRLDRAEALVGHPLSTRSTELLAGLLLSEVRLSH